MSVGSNPNPSIFTDDASGSEWTADLAGIAHDLRAPLSVLDGYTEMLASGDVGPVSEPARRVLEVMAAKLAEMRGLVDGLVEAARPEDALDEALGRRSLDLVDVASQAVARAEPRARLTGRRLDLVLDGHAPVRAEPRLLARILDNLINNALVHSGSGRSVTVSVQRDGSYGQVRVHDAGPGVPADVRANLFRPLRTSLRDAPPSRGAGLGLSICRTLAARCGASLVLEPGTGKGATFLLELPLAASRCN